MMLNLFPFPQRSDHPLADAKELKRVLAELRVDKPANAVDEVAGWFESLQDAAGFRLNLYFDVIRQLDDVAQPHLRSLGRDYLLSPGLSKLGEERLWATSYGYWRQLAALYAECAERARLDPKGKGTHAFKASLPLALVRSQAARCNELKWLAYCYGSESDEVWKGLGATYLAAEATGDGQKLVQLYPARQGLCSVAQQYLHAIVFSTSSMDSLTPLEMELADRLTAHFLPKFALSPDCRPDSIYWLDAARGSAPLRLARPPGNTSSGLRFLSPGTARAALDELTHIVERGEVPADLNLGGEYSKRALLPVLRHLAVHWALRPPKRMYQRHPVTTRMQVLHGFDECYSVFSGAQPSGQDRRSRESWVVENVSLGGFRVHVDDLSGERIKLGSLLCAQPEGGENWLLGVTRRFNRVAGRRTCLGVQVLARHALSIELAPRRSGFAVAVAVPGIWLRDGAEAGVERIVLPLGGFNVREIMEFNDEGRRRVLAPVELEESGRDYEIGRFHDQ